MKNIVVLVNKERRLTVFSQKYYDMLKKLGNLKVYDKDDFSNKEYYLNFVKGADVIITSWDSPVIDKDVLDACPNLLGVIHAAGSIKPIISSEFISRKIRIANSAVAIGEGVAEAALGFLISACKGFYTLNKNTHSGLWQEGASNIVKDFYDIKIGVISGGFVGRHMVKLLKNFHVDIYMYDPILSKEQIEEIGAIKVDLNTLMSTCDAITVHAPSIPATDNMINKENLKLLKDGAILVNTARGTIINEQDLINELKTGRIFACIDVTNPEPPAKENELRYLDNCVLTPHIAGAYTNGLKRVALHACEETERLISGNKMRAEVNLDNLSKLA